MCHQGKDDNGIMKTNAVDKPKHDKLDEISYKHAHAMRVVKNVISHDANLDISIT